MEVRMNVLVTGGAGYIGSHTAKALALAGDSPVTFDNLSKGHRWAVQWGPLVEADLADTDSIRRTIDEHQIEAVIHFAADILVGESVQNPRKYFQNNVVNSLNLLNAMLDAGVGNVILSSTAAIYGEPQWIPLDETHPKQPISPYGDAKLFIERALQWYENSYGLKWAALRYFNASGADPEGRIGECHDPESHLIPLIVAAVLGTSPQLSVFGTDYPTEDGTAIRDYVHVEDLADAHVLALRYLVDGGKSDAFNIGTGHGYSVREVIESVERVSGRSVPVTEGPRRPGDPPRLVADASKARRVLGWEPNYTDLDDIVRTAWNWHSRSGDTKGLGPIA
jgi:UDP-glucose-4-epimerase GalE